VHKVHHQYTQTISIAAIHTHPLEYFLGNIIPSVLPTTILGPRCHLVTVWAFATIRIAITTCGHSGYALPWYPWDFIILKAPPEYHDFHHSDSGNYAGTTTILDDILGTNKKYYRQKKLD